jgi:hypothetical protein
MGPGSLSGGDPIVLKKNKATNRVDKVPYITASEQFPYSVKKFNLEAAAGDCKLQFLK